MDIDHNIYVGLVVQNNDPDMRGRVKVYIPSISPTINKLINENVDKFFNFIGKETQNNEITQSLEELKAVLPWSEYAGPVFGGSSSGRYNNTISEGTTSDSNKWDNNKPVDGFRPAQNYVGYQKIPDAFKAIGEHSNRFVNPYTYEYTPANYSGLARGLFSIPNVGSHVYVFFIHGDRNFPVYFASAYGQDDVKRIFTLSQDVNDNSCNDYPKTYENVKKNSFDEDVKTFRSKTVLNSNKHTLELIDTDLKEIVRLTHYSGSFREMNNFSSIELDTNNHQKMVRGDQFITINKNKSEYVRNDSELIIGGDSYRTIGEVPENVVQNIYEINREIHEYKLLFDVQRAEYGEITKFGNPKDLSKYQKRSGVFAPCPVCKGLPYNPYDNSYGQDIIEMWRASPAYMSNICINPFASLPATETQDSDETESTSVVSIFTPTCQKIEGGPFAIPTEYCQPLPHQHLGKIGYYRGSKCACCEGTGFSLSTENGKFDVEPHKQQNSTLDQLIVKQTPNLINLEKQLGLGGDEIIDDKKSRIETIGTIMNDLLSYRVDPIGKLKIDGCWVAPQGTYENLKPSPHVEYVDVTDIPGGDWIVTAMNKFKLLVGSKGVNIMTYGPLDIYGSIVNFNGEQINMSSKNEIVIDGGERLSLRARKISLVPVEHNAVVVEGQLHVTRNAIINGGSMFEGEIGLLHITAPLEWQQTAIALWEPTAQCTPINAVINGSPAIVTLPNHTHYFKNLPLTLLEHPEAVRESMIIKGINSRNKIAAASRASNIGNCPQNLLDIVSPEFIRAAWNESKKQAAIKNSNVETEWAEWDSVYNSGEMASNGPMTGPESSSAIRSAETVNETTTITITYKWKMDFFYGIVKVTGVLDNEAQLIKGPTISK